ncbi:myb family transcription factor PHL5-like [Nymphaea colorata]|nr:myb family transcription factor PHL5-like [Nymphaea colorata]
MNAQKMECFKQRNGVVSDIPYQNLDLHQYPDVQTRQLCNLGACIPTSSPYDAMSLMDPEQSSAHSHESIQFLGDHLPNRSAASTSRLRPPYLVNSNQFGSPQLVCESIDNFSEFGHGGHHQGYNSLPGELPRNSLQMHFSELMQPEVSSDAGKAYDFKSNNSLQPMSQLSSYYGNHHPSVAPVCEVNENNSSKWNELDLNLQRQTPQLETNLVNMSSQGNWKHEGRGEVLDWSENKFGGVQNSIRTASSRPLSAGSKTRMRWTQDLHEQFVKSVNRLGGAEKATPKGILKLMNSDKLTIFQVKSHLQKYRMAKGYPESAVDTLATSTSSDGTPQMDMKSGKHIAKALRLQMDVQKLLHEQLEVQRNLQVRIEEHGKYLQKLLEQQQKCSRRLFASQEKDAAGSDELSDVIEDAEESCKDGPQDVQSVETIETLKLDMHGRSTSGDL